MMLKRERSVGISQGSAEDSEDYSDRGNPFHETFEKFNVKGSYLQKNTQLIGEEILEEEKQEDYNKKGGFSGILESVGPNGTLNYEAGGNTIDTRAASQPSTPNGLEEGNQTEEKVSEHGGFMRKEFEEVSLQSENHNIDQITEMRTESYLKQREIRHL